MGEISEKRRAAAERFIRGAKSPYALSRFLDHWEPGSDEELQLPFEYFTEGSAPARAVVLLGDVSRKVANDSKHWDTVLDGFYTALAAICAEIHPVDEELGFKDEGGVV